LTAIRGTGRGILSTWKIQYNEMIRARHPVVLLNLYFRTHIIKIVGGEVVGIFTPTN